MKPLPALNEPLPRPDRPLGVSILTIWDGAMAGLLPAFQAVFMVLRGTTDPNDISLLTLCLAVGLPIAIVTAAIGTFSGSDRSRLSLLVLVTLYYGLNAFRDASLIAAGAVSGNALFGAYFGILSAVFWAAVNIWYFLRPRTIAFYRRPIRSWL
jgi:hypothetical protein